MVLQPVPHLSLECSTLILHFPVPTFQLSSLPGAWDINLIAWSSLLSKQYPSYSHLLDTGPGNGEKKFKKSLDISLSLTLLPSLAFIARIQWKDIVWKKIVKKEGNILINCQFNTGAFKRSKQKLNYYWKPVIYFEFND